MNRQHPNPKQTSAPRRLHPMTALSSSAFASPKKDFYALGLPDNKNPRRLPGISKSRNPLNKRPQKRWRGARKRRGRTVNMKVRQIVVSKSCPQFFQHDSLESEREELERLRFKKFALEDALLEQQAFLEETRRQQKMLQEQGYSEVPEQEEGISRMQMHTLEATLRTGESVLGRLKHRLNEHMFDNRSQTRWEHLMRIETNGDHCIQRVREHLAAYNKKNPIELDLALDELEKAEEYFRKAGSSKMREEEVISLENDIDKMPTWYVGALALQKICRGWLGRRRTSRLVAKSRLAVMKTCAIFLQSRFRGMQLRMGLSKAATGLQKVFRGRSGRIRVKKTRSARHMQRIVRGKQGRRRAKQKKIDNSRHAAAIKVQSQYRRKAGKRIADSKRRQKLWQETENSRTLLKLCCNNAENLAKADTFGASDPFCEIHLQGPQGDQVLGRTAVIKDTQSPSWHETIPFILPHKANWEEWELRVEVYDDDNGKHQGDFLGEVRLVGEEILAGPQGITYLKNKKKDFSLLKKRKQKYVKGKIGLSFHYKNIKKETAARREEEVYVPGKGKRKQSTLTLASIPNRGRKMSQGQINGTEELLQEKPKTMMINIERASGLAKADTFGKSDPFCKILFNGSVQAKTAVKAKTLEPRWNFQTYLQVPSGGLKTSDLVQIQVWDNNTIGSNTFLGQVKFTGNDIMQGLASSIQFYRLSRVPEMPAHAQKHVQGELQLFIVRPR